jgi:GR25 family glycosyltransferase involved in LPS biosynthesis
MDFLYINLKGADERQQFLEHNFKQNFPAHRQNLHRVEAVNTTQVAQECIPGKLHSAAKGCFLSHVRAAEIAARFPTHVMIMEDDILFSPKSEATIHAALQMLADREWDLLFTDICTPHPVVMVYLFQLRRKLVKDQSCQLLNLKGIGFAGSTGYVVNRQSQAKFHAILRQCHSLDVPLDLYIRDQVDRGCLTAVAVFPYATSLSHFADASQVSAGDGSIPELAWNCFRRLMWIDAHPELVVQSLRSLGEHCQDPDASAFAQILKTLLAADCIDKWP